MTWEQVLVVCALLSIIVFGFGVRDDIKSRRRGK